MGLAFQCDNLTCRKFLLAGKDLVFILMNNNESKENRCLECIVLMKNEKEKTGIGKFDVNKISLFDYPGYRSNE